MKEIEKYSNIPPNDQKLIFKGKILKAEDPISNHKIENGVTIIMVKKGKTETQKTETQKTETQNTETQKNRKSKYRKSKSTTSPTLCFPTYK
jgi:Zn-dependent metalloprotease